MSDDDMETGIIVQDDGEPHGDAASGVGEALGDIWDMVSGSGSSNADDGSASSPDDWTSGLGLGLSDSLSDPSYVATENEEIERERQQAVAEGLDPTQRTSSTRAS